MVEFFNVVYRKLKKENLANDKIQYCIVKSNKICKIAIHIRQGTLFFLPEKDIFHVGTLYKL